MNRRKNHKILRSFKNGLALENTFEVTKNDEMNKVFDDSAENILVHYTNGMRHCVMEDGFPYFYVLDKDGTALFPAICYSSVGFIADENYSSFDDVVRLFKKFNKANKEAEKFFFDSYAHFQLQKNGTFSYCYNLETGNHIVIYNITNDVKLNIEFHFTSSTVVLRCNYNDNKKTKNTVKVLNGSFEYVCRRAFKDAAIFGCLEDDTIDFNSDFNEIFRLSEIVDF